MTEKQERFIDEYIIDFNATRAAIAAGYSSKRANSQGVHLLSIPEIQAEVRRRKAEISAGLRISAERVLWEMAALGFSNIFDYRRGTSPKRTSTRKARCRFQYQDYKERHGSQATR